MGFMSAAETDPTIANPLALSGFTADDAEAAANLHQALVTRHGAGFKSIKELGLFGAGLQLLLTFGYARDGRSGHEIWLPF